MDNIIDLQPGKTITLKFSDTAFLVIECEKNVLIIDGENISIGVTADNKAIVINEEARKCSLE